MHRLSFHYAERAIWQPFSLEVRCMVYSGNQLGTATPLGFWDENAIASI